MSTVTPGVTRRSRCTASSAPRSWNVVPAGKPDRPLVVDRYYEADKQAITRYLPWAMRRDADEITDAQLADAIEREELPDWRAAYKTLEEGALDDEWSAMRQQARVRIEAMTGFAAALRSGDRAAQHRHLQALSNNR